MFQSIHHRVEACIVAVILLTLTPPATAGEQKPLSGCPVDILALCEVCDDKGNCRWVNCCAYLGFGPALEKPPPEPNNIVLTAPLTCVESCRRRLTSLQEFNRCLEGCGLPPSEFATRFTAPPAPPTPCSGPRTGDMPPPDHRDPLGTCPSRATVYFGATESSDGETGVSVGLALQYAVTDRFAVELLAGRDELEPDAGPPDQTADHLSLNGKYYLPLGDLPLFLVAGAGFYDLDPGTTESGWNAGVGLQLLARGRAVVEIDVRQHTVDATAAEIEFLTLHAGVGIRF